MCFAKYLATTNEEVTACPSLTSIKSISHEEEFSILIISVLIFVPILCVYTIFTTKFIMRIIALCVYTILSALPVKMVRFLLTTVLPVLSIHHICRSSAFSTSRWKFISVKRNSIKARLYASPSRWALIRRIICLLSNHNHFCDWDS